MKNEIFYLLVLFFDIARLQIFKLIQPRVYENAFYLISKASRNLEKETKMTPDKKKGYVTSTKIKLISV